MEEYDYAKQFKKKMQVDVEVSPPENDLDVQMAILQMIQVIKITKNDYTILLKWQTLLNAIIFKIQIIFY